MSKKTIVLESIDPIEIYGAANKNLEALCTYFPNLKVVARGNEIILEGTEEDTLSFEKKLHMLIERRQHKMNVTPYDVEDLFDGDATPDRFKLCGQSTIVHGNDGKPIKARNRTQQEMVKAYFENDLIFAVGPAGSGKTYTAIALAVRALKNREVKRIILSRPAVEAGEKLGFLPGDLQQKIDPYLRPLYDALFEMLGPENYQRHVERGTIEIAPLAYMRGRTLDDSFIILDEAQNTTPEQMKMFLTRMGWNSKMIITGDMTQIDLPRSQQSGLKEALGILKDIEGIGIVELNTKDIVRHKLVTKIVNAYDKHDKEYNKKIEQNESIN